MGKKLAIKGHPTRGKEVIELLEMMGGEAIRVKGNDDTAIYVIPDNGIIDVRFAYQNRIDNFAIFTLEEFLEKYPFKVGDKVFDKVDGDPGIIIVMKWDEDVYDMKYRVAFDNGDMGWYTNDTIGFLKCKRTHEDVIFDSIIWHLRNSVNNGKQNLSGGECEDYFREVVKKNSENKMKNVLAELLDHINNTSKEELEKEFKEIEEWSNVGPTVEEFMDFCNKVNKKPKYPKTYEECCKVLDFCGDYFLTTYEPDCMVKKEVYGILQQVNSLTQLLICKSAYWKIAGEEMGLGKPWKLDWKNRNQKKYCIYYEMDDIQIGSWYYGNCILAFPTKEMRSAFYKNFKNLIKSCKELL